MATKSKVKVPKFKGFDEPWALNDLMEIVHNAYPDEFTREYWDEKKSMPKESSGDTLAEFIVREIHDTFDPKAAASAQLQEAARVMRTAERELGEIAEMLERTLEA